MARRGQHVPALTSLRVIFQGHARHTSRSISCADFPQPEPRQIAGSFGSLTPRSTTNSGSLVTVTGKRLPHRGRVPSTVFRLRRETGRFRDSFGRALSPRVCNRRSRCHNRKRRSPGWTRAEHGSPFDNRSRSRFLDIVSARSVGAIDTAGKIAGRYT